MQTREEKPFPTPFITYIRLPGHIGWFTYCISQQCHVRWRIKPGTGWDAKEPWHIIGS